MEIVLHSFVLDLLLARSVFVPVSHVVLLTDEAAGGARSSHKSLAKCGGDRSC